MESTDLPEVAYRGQLIFVSDMDQLAIQMPGSGGDGWQYIGAPSSDFSITYVGPSPPPSPDVGDQWLNTTDGTLYTWDGSGWTDSIGTDDVTEVELAPEAITDKHTIIGAVFKTSESGNRIQMRNDGSGGVIEGYSGVGGEVSPSKVNPGFTGGRPTLQLRAGSQTALPGGTLLLYGDSSGTDRKAEINCNTEVSGDLTATQSLWSLSIAGDSGTLPHAVWGASGQLKKQTSSARYKEDIEPLEMDVHTLLKLTPKQFKDKVSGAKGVGFIAEEAADLGLERWVYRRPEDKKPESFGYVEWTSALQKICQSQQRQIDELMHRVATLERMAGGHS